MASLNPVQSSGIVNVLPYGIVLPGLALEILGDFCTNKKTGSIGLNFIVGKIGSVDIKQHNIVGMVQCASCGELRHRNDKFWTVRNRVPYCPRCDERPTDKKWA